MTHACRSPFTRAGKTYEPSKFQDSDISFVSSGRPSVERMFPTLYEDQDSASGIALGRFSDYDGRNSFASSYSSQSQGIDDHSFSSQSRLSDCTDDVEFEMRRLKLELKQTMEMYSSVCKEAMTAKQKAMELQRWKVEEQKKLEDSSMSSSPGEAVTSSSSSMALMEMEQEKIREEALQKIAALEAQKRMSLQMERKKPEEKTVSSFGHTARYRRYTIEEIEEATNMFSESLKIGEGGYGPVYRYVNYCCQILLFNHVVRIVIKHKYLDIK